jgi:predicted small lipoprotein YifL
MNRRPLALLLALLTVCSLTACARKAPPPPPDLTGEWRQPTEEEWYHVATITEDTIEVWWYLPAYDRRDLYWSGTFTPPADGTEPYEWTSVNRYTEEQLDAHYRFHRASREETKVFTYQDGKISYNVTAGHLRLGYALERAE